MSAHNDKDLVVAISHDNRMLHIARSDVLRLHLEMSGQTVQRSMAAKKAVASTAEPVPLDYYDSMGHPLAADLTRAVHEERLLTRIRAVLAHMQAMLDEHPELGDTGPDTPRVTQVPQLEGSLSDVVEQLNTLFDIEDPLDRNKGNWWHMMAHAAGTARH